MRKLFRGINGCQSPVDLRQLVEYDHFLILPRSTPITTSAMIKGVFSRRRRRATKNILIHITVPRYKATMEFLLFAQSDPLARPENREAPQLTISRTPHCGTSDPIGAKCDQQVDSTGEVAVWNRYTWQSPSVESPLNHS